MKRAVIVGGTSTIAEHCARLWLQQSPMELWLVGRDKVQLESVAADLKIRSPESQIHVDTIDFLEPTSIEQLVKRVARYGDIDLVLITHGSLPDQSACETNLAMTEEQLFINGISPVLFAEAFAHSMQSQSSGQIAIIGSVAGDRGRKSNYLYGAAKGLLERYVEGMQHRFAQSTLSISLIKPGPTLTAMTRHLVGDKLALSDAGDVASVIVQGLKREKPVIYAPRRWALIMLVIRNLPRIIFDRLDI